MRALAGRLVLSAAIAGVLIAPGFAGPAFVRAGVCTGWTSAVTPPPTIQVYRVSRGVVQTVDFKTYVKVVTAAEWPTTYPYQAFRAGAVVAKQYAWYYAIHWRGGSAGGHCYDVRDDSNDQIYSPESRKPTADQARAVEETWPETIRKNAAFILTGYRPGSEVPCGQDVDGYHLMQHSARRCALAGQTAEQILELYYDPGMALIGGPAPPGAPTAPTATAMTSAASVGWTAPANATVFPITSYTVTSSPGGLTCTTSGLSCVVRGLANGTPYTFTVTASNYGGTGPASTPTTAVTPTPSTYYPVNPTRLLDTRSGTGLSGKFSANSPRTFVVTGSGIPDDATAVTGNLTVVNQSTKGWLYVGPDALPSPISSSLNFPAGDIRANNVTVALGSLTVGGVRHGSLSITYGPSGGIGTTDVVFDVTGYFRADETAQTHGATYYPVTPARILDTRIGTGLSGAFSSTVPRAFQVRGVGGIPANAVAVTGNLTITAQTSKGHMYIGPIQAARPSSSNLNFPVGDNRANGVTVMLTSDGKLYITYVGQAAGTTAHAIFDVTGYYVNDLNGASYVPLAPTRLVDTRIGTGLTGKFNAGEPRALAIAGAGGVDRAAVGITGNLTVVGQTYRGFLYMGPNPVAVPGSSTLNFPQGDIRANGVTVPLDAGAAGITYVAPAGSTTDVVFDVTGYFAK